jgi:hypothetical protein
MVLLFLFLLLWGAAIGYLQWHSCVEAREQLRICREQLQKQLQASQDQLAAVEQISFALLTVSTMLGSKTANRPARP